MNESQSITRGDQADVDSLERERRQRLHAAGVALLRLEPYVPTYAQARLRWALRAVEQLEQAIAKPQRRVA